MIDKIKKQNWKINLNAKQKKILIISGTMLIILVAFFIIYTPNSKTPKKEQLANDRDPNLKYNLNEEFIKEQNIDGITFTKIQCTYDGTQSQLSYIITNNTSEPIQLNEYDIIVKDKKKNTLTIMQPNIEEILAPGDELPIINQVNIDITDAYYLELELKNKKEGK